MLRHLLVKDLRRVWARPTSHLLFLALPICVTALIGLVFGPSTGSQTLGTVKLAIVDEDDSVLGRLIRSAFDQEEAREHIEARFLGRTEALERIRKNELSAILIVPEGFTDRFLEGNPVPALELIKNPAQSFHPAIVEELLGVVVAGLNAAANSLGEELLGLLRAFDKAGLPDLRILAGLMIRAADKFEAADQYLFPPLISFRTEVRENPESADDELNAFAFLLPGLASMFLLFLADGAIRDIYREVRLHTFDRFRTTCPAVLPFVISKVILAIVLLLIGSAVLFGAGGLVFGVRWQHPFKLIVLMTAFALFASGFMALFAALARTEKRADVMNSAIIFGLAFIGGSFFPSRELPAFLRETITPWMPSYWMIEGFRQLEFGTGGLSWEAATVRLLLFGAAAVAAAAYLLNRSLFEGVRG